jgi:hypothetical protein
LNFSKVDIKSPVGILIAAMPDRSKTRLRDPNELAHRIFLESIGEAEKTDPLAVTPKNPHAVALGRMGGQKGGAARAQESSRLNPISTRPTL